MYGGDIDYSSPLVCIHARQDGFCEQEWGGEHEFDDLPPFRLWKLGDWCDILDARVVYQDVYLPMGGDGVCHKLLKIGRVSQVGVLETCSGQFGC